MGVNLDNVKGEKLLEVLGTGDWAIALPNGYPDLVLTVAWRQALSQTACHWFVRWVLGGITYEIRHDNDPPWDSSGEAQRISEDPEMLLIRHDTLKSWMEQEYTGNKKPTFSSFCGWSWDTYENDFQDAISENLFELVRIHLSKCVEVVDNLDASDEIGNVDIQLEYVLMEIVGHIKTADAWRKYETEVTRLLSEERQEMAARAARYARMRQLSRDFWLQHFSDLQQERDRQVFYKIELPVFDDLKMEARLTEALADADPEAVAAIASVGLPISCSNSVEHVIKHLAQQAMTDCQHVAEVYGEF